MSKPSERQSITLHERECPNMALSALHLARGTLTGAFRAVQWSNSRRFWNALDLQRYSPYVTDYIYALDDGRHVVAMAGLENIYGLDAYRRKQAEIQTRLREFLTRHYALGDDDDEYYVLLRRNSVVALFGEESCNHIYTVAPGLTAHQELADRAELEAMHPGRFMFA